MEKLVFENGLQLARHAAAEITSLLDKKPSAVICMASGNSPKATCEEFVSHSRARGTDTSHFYFIGLDEWVGVPPEISGSCHNDFRERLFTPLGMGPDRYHLFNGMSGDLDRECAEMDRVISGKGGIDLMIVGIGMNGHIGFNEPGCGFELLSHIADLDDLTASVGQKYFSMPMQLKQGITLGLGHLQAARKVILIATGSSKASIVDKALHGPVTEKVPASIMQQLEHGVVLLDRDAAGM